MGSADVFGDWNRDGNPPVASMVTKKKGRCDDRIFDVMEQGRRVFQPVGSPGEM